jgi:lipoprotein-anchoring transpeptidase ErfK/SrfK
MRLGRPPDSQRGFAQRRFGFLHVIAVIGLVTACWYVWNRTRTSPFEVAENSTPPPAFTREAPADVPRVQPVVTNHPQIVAPTNFVTSPPPVVPANTFPEIETNVVVAPVILTTNTDGSVTLPGWIVEPPDEALFASHAARDVLEAQVGLANRGISPGPIDGVMGSQTRLAIRAFQEQLGIPITGELDAYTRRALWVRQNPITTYLVTTDNLARLMTVPDTWLEKSEAARLDYETALELVAERGWAYESFIRSRNPEIDWLNVTAGTKAAIPNVRLPKFNSKAAYAKIHLADRNLQAYDANGRIMIHFPCSIAQRVDKRPLGELHVAVVVREPNYTFNPEIFTESEEGRMLGRKLTVPPGPNNPVGVVWVGLDRQGYGIHGTPAPEMVGRTESHGCFRLANWNARILAEIAWPGMPVYIEN